jgi:hypothetical protein
MRTFNGEVCAGTCVCGSMIEKNAMQLIRVVGLEVAVPVVEGEDGPVAAVGQSGRVVPRVDLVLARVDTGEFFSEHVDVLLE